MPHLNLLADLVLILATIGVAVYAHRLGRRVRKMADLDDGLGAAVAALSTHVDRLSGLHAEIRGAVDAESTRLTTLTAQADERIGRMELLLASLDDAEPGRPAVMAMPETTAAPTFRHTGRASAEELV